MLHDKRSLDDALAATVTHEKWRHMEGRDRAYARLIAATVLRRYGELEAAINAFLQKPLPAHTGYLWPILLSAAAQLLFLETPPHAAISLAVDHVRTDPKARRFDKLVNAVLRRVSERGAEVLRTQDAIKLNIPAWLWQRWQSAYGDATARLIAEASLQEAPLDLTVKADAADWAEKLGGIVLPTGSVRLDAHGRVDELPGFAEGAWWVQDAAATLPARLLGAVAGMSVAEICAAPGGKTAQLAAAGANVAAVDISEARLVRLTANLQRLGLAAETIAADAATWQPGRLFDAVLLDAPCTSTGTIRRHPDILRLKRDSDIAALSATQAALLANCATLVKPGGLLVYCTCSLEPEEGADQIERFLAAASDFSRAPLDPAEFGGSPDWITPVGDLRTLPHHFPMSDTRLSGMDGFFAARLRRRADP